jgi:hypothetical protein
MKPVHLKMNYCHDIVLLMHPKASTLLLVLFLEPLLDHEMHAQSINQYMKCIPALAM